VTRGDIRGVTLVNMADNRGGRNIVSEPQFVLGQDQERVASECTVTPASTRVEQGRTGEERL